MIYNFNNLAFDLYLQRQELCVISYGGSCSNALVDVLEKNGYRIRTDLWRDILCHCPVYFDMNIPVIYIYDNPIKSFLSMKRRGNNYWGTNQEKLSNNEKIEYSDENLLKLMIRQFKLWTKRKSKNLLVLKSDELFNPNVSNKIKKFLKNMFISDLPLKYKKSKTDISEMLDEERELFSKYKEDIDIINNYK
jgi:hypothetical protein